MKKLFLLLLFACVPVVAQDVTPEPAEESPYDVEVPDVKPNYEGGIKAFHSFMSHEIRVPTINSAEDLSLKIYVSFIVEKDGSISDVKALRDPGYGMGDEAVRVIKLTDKKWTAGVKEGKPVRASFKFPITINIKGTGKTEEKKE